MGGAVVCDVMCLQYSVRRIFFQRRADRTIDRTIFPFFFLFFVLSAKLLNGMFKKKKWKTSAVSTTDWMVETQLCNLRGTSDTFVGRAYFIFHTSKYIIWCLWTNPTIWLLILSLRKVVRACSIFYPRERYKSVTPLDAARVEKRQLWVLPCEWLKLNFASCVVHQIFTPVSYTHLTLPTILRV